MQLGTALKRTGKFAYQAMLVAKALPPNWGRSTLLLRFTEKTGVSTVFIVTGDAIEKFDSCDMWRIYDMELPGKCVKQSEGIKRYGVRNTHEVRLQFPCSLSLSKKAWPVSVQYDCVHWSSLNQLENNDFIDLVGHVFEKSDIDVTDGLP